MGQLLTVIAGRVWLAMSRFHSLGRDRLLTVLENPAWLPDLRHVLGQITRQRLLLKKKKNKKIIITCTF